MTVAAVVISGVAGTGKTTIAGAVAQALAWTFVDGDALHPAANVAKMASGTPLDDADRAPWLAALRDLLDSHLAQATPIVVTTSLLKRRYRDAIGLPRDDVLWVHLTAPRTVLAARLAARRDHFLPPSLLDSQLAALEPPQPDERALVVDTARPLHEVVPPIVAAARGIEGADPPLPVR